MGRTVIAEENLKGVVDDLYGTHRWQIGLIVGQVQIYSYMIRF